ncbi:MAG: DNA-processing protein DprA [Actinomycetales bacterium]
MTPALQPAQQAWSEERLARLALSRLCEPGDPTMARLVRSEGPAGALAHVRDDRQDDPPQLAQWRSRLPALDVDQDVRCGAAAGARFAMPGDEEWPAERLAGLDDVAGETPREAPAPLGLWLRGPVPLAEYVELSAAVVGCRAATMYGIAVAGELGQELGSGGVCVISGAAYGIDRAAHEGALLAQGPTVAVLAGGVDVPYPRGNSDLIARVGRRGLLVAEAPPRAAPTRVRFLRRNRLIAALGCCTVVVEAAHRSGALSTAAVARHLMRPVAAVPGPVSSSASAGCLRLLREPEVTLVRDARDIRELIRLGELGLGDGALEPAEQPRLFDLLSEAELRVVEAIPVRRPVDLAGILRVAGLDVVTVQSALTRLESQGLAVCADGMWSRAT